MAAFQLGAVRLRRIEGLVADPPHGGGLRGWFDLNGDGYDDLIGTGAYYPFDGNNPTPRRGWVAFGDAEGYHAALATEIPLATLLNVHAAEFVVADFNGDRVPDFFIADTGYDAPPFPGRQNLLYMSANTGRWIDATGALPQQADFTHSAAAGDVDGDGDVDLFAGNGGFGACYLLLGDGRGGFTPSTGVLPNGAGAPLSTVGVYACVLADFDGDSKAELILGSDRVGAGIQILWNQGGRFTGLGSSVLAPPPNFGDLWYPHEMQIADVNLDGRPDVIANYIGDAFAGGWALRIYLNQGGHAFTDATASMLTRVEAQGAPAVGSPIVPTIRGLRPLDLNADGRIDFVVEHIYLNGDRPTGAFPKLLIQRPLGGYDAITVADLQAAGLPSNTLWSLDYARRGGQEPGELVNMYFDLAGDGAAWVSSQSITFAAPSSRWHPGTSAGDTLVGGVGADWFGGFGGNDRIDGGAGIDLARFGVARAEARVERAATAWSVVSTAEGSDTLTGVERLWFADAHVALDIDGHAGQAARVLNTAFGQSALSNRELVGLVLHLLDQGLTAEGLLTLAIQTEEFARVAGGRSNAAFVDWVFRNVTGRSATAEEGAVLVGVLDRGEQTQLSLAILASDSAANGSQVNLTGLAGTGIAYSPFEA